MPIADYEQRLDSERTEAVRKDVKFVENTFFLIRILLYIVMVNMQKILPVKNTGLKHLKKEKKMKNLYMVNTDKYMQKKLWQ